MKLIVAVDQNWGIGCRGQLLAHVRADLQHFRALSAGKTVILGSRTLATFPGGKPLPKRRNIVLSRRADYAVPGAETAHSVAEVLALTAESDPGDVIVIGGESVYRQLLPYCTEAEVTRFDRAFASDASFPALPALPDWELAAAGDWQTSDPETDSETGLRFRFETYRRKPAGEKVL